MKKSILAVVALLALTASVANAAGVNLFYNGCDGDLTPGSDRTNACTSDVGNLTKIVASYVAPGGVTALSGIEIVLDVQTSGSALPAWWDVSPAGCRENAVAATYVLADNPSCNSAWAAAPVFGGLAAFRAGEGGANRGRMIIGWAVSPTNVRQLNMDAEYYASNISISRANSSACTGCLVPACLVLNQITLAQPVGTPGGDRIVSNMAASNFVTYQGGVVQGGCPGAVPTKNRTWGAVKSLYR